MTDITNSTADARDSVYEVCAVSGFRAKRNSLIQRWDGRWVLPKFNEPRNEQDFARGKKETSRGSRTPQESPNYIETNYPDGVSASDL